MTSTAPATIRPLVEADASALQALRAAALLDSPTAFGASPSEDFSRSIEETRERITAAGDRVILGAFSGDTLIGMVGIAREHSIKHAHKAGLWGMCVAPSHRGSGAGKRLVNEALKFSANLSGVRQVNLYVNATNAIAIALYESLGFVTFGVEHDGLMVDGVAHDELLMVRILSALPIAPDDEGDEAEPPRRIRTLPGLTLAQTELAELMSDISEDHYCAGWLIDLEYSLWSIVTGDSANTFGFGAIERWKIKRLKALSAATGGWIERQRDAEHETFVPMEIWLKQFAARQTTE